MRFPILPALFITATMAMSAAFAHTPLCSCYDMGDGTVLCEGGFSDGSSAAGINIRIVDRHANNLLEGVMSENSEFEFDKPEGDYSVIFDAGPGHVIEISSRDIRE